MTDVDLLRALDASLPQSEWLTDDELVALTALKQPSAQAKQLQRLGLAAFRRPDGHLIVSRWAVRLKAAGVRLSGADGLVGGNGIRWTVPLSGEKPPQVRPVKPRR